MKNMSLLPLLPPFGMQEALTQARAVGVAMSGMGKAIWKIVTAEWLRDIIYYNVIIHLHISHHYSNSATKTQLSTSNNGILSCPLVLIFKRYRCPVSFSAYLNDPNVGRVVAG